VKQTAGVLFLFITLVSCGPRIHSVVENPKKPGRYPALTKAQALLVRKSNRRNCFDVTYNRLDIKIDPAKKFISGNVIIHAKALKKIDTLQIDLAKNMKLNSVTQNEKPLDYKRKEGAIFIMPQGIESGQTFSLMLSYEGSPVIAKNPPWQGGAVWRKDGREYPWCGIACETEGANIWWPNKDDVSDEADSTDIIVTVADTLMAVCNGVLRNAQQNNDRTKTYHWHVSYPINNYNVTYYIGKFKLIEDVFQSKVNNERVAMNFYVLPGHYELAKKHFLQAKDHISFYEQVFGPYPWPHDGYKLVESPYEGMEHQTAIAYGSAFKNEAEGFDYIILHESAHEWWGNSVTAADLSDVWLQEGFATYAEALYVEKLHGYDDYLNYLHYQKYTILNKRPVVRKREIRYFDSSDEDVYTKGSWILHTLRGTIQDDALFFDIIKTFRMQNHMKQIYSETFIDLVSAKTGKDYNWFFRQYLFNREAPILESYWIGKDIYYRWKNTAADFDKLPVKIALDREIKTIYPGQKVQKMRLENLPESAQFKTELGYYGHVENKKLIRQFAARNK
jgi:aminopeptidase N